MKAPGQITILTDPVPLGGYFLSEGSKRIARAIRDRLRPGLRRWDQRKYRGHFAVTRSLVEGLRNAGRPFNYNPTLVREINDTVVVLAGVSTLRQAIELKRRGIIRCLFAGPNIVIFSSDADSIVASPEIDAVITPCDWVIDMYAEDHPSLRTRCFAWPAGVDTDYWKPGLATERKQILLFEKQDTGPVGPVEPFAEYVRRKGYPVTVIRYGAYTHASYLQELQRSQLMIGFVTGESQGIAWAEAWSADVPTLLWRNNINVYRGRRYNCSTAPYLRPENGMFFDDMDDFKVKFARWETTYEQFSARAWALANMSDEVCATQLYERVTAC